MKVIFLDIDGVLNNGNTFSSQREALIEEAIDKDGLSFSDAMAKYMIEKHLVDNLNSIVNETGAKIVISSTWRKGSSIDRLQYIFNLHGFVGEIIDKTPVLDTFRGTEIQKWLDENKQLGVEKFIILDDDDDMGYLDYCLVQTCFVDGLIQSDVEKAIGLLNGD